ncbi:MAG: hypothetical protein AB7K52_01855 [Phycisphaerales bacterium]
MPAPRFRAKFALVVLAGSVLSMGSPARADSEPAPRSDAPSAQPEESGEQPSTRRRRGAAPAAEEPPKPELPMVPVDTSEVPVPDDTQGFSGLNLDLPRPLFAPGPLVATPDRWRIGWPSWDRYGRATALDEAIGMSINRSDAATTRGSILNPYDRSVIKGDYPVIGNDIFFNFTAISDTLVLYRRNITPSGNAAQQNSSFQQFKDGRGTFINQNFILAFELTHGYTAFRPIDWAVKVVPIFNMNYLTVRENAVNIDPLFGDDRYDSFETLQEALVDLHLGDTSEFFDIITLKIGRQLFNSDFRGFVFNDLSDGVRLTGNLMSNRLQYNIAFFNAPEKDTNSLLNELNWRDQQIFIANAYYQDFIFPGYTIQGSFHYNHDSSDERFDTNGFPVRPDLAGSPAIRDLDVYYLGLTSDGHMGRLNVSSAFYYAFGEDEFNPIAGQPVDISAFLAALELSVDFDWFRPKVSFLYVSGDDDPTDDTGEGFDSIFDDVNFAGGPSSFYQLQPIRLFGVGLNQFRSFYNTLKSSKFEGQSNFVNPGTIVFNLGFDAELTPKLRASFNANHILFAQTETLDFFTNQFDIDPEVGTEVNLLFQYRPLLNNNIILTVSGSLFFPGDGFAEVYGERDTLFQIFTGVTLTY